MMRWFSSLSDRTEVYLGDENSLSLTFNARNEGEGGAYEAELYVVLPPEADYSGIARSNVVRQTAVTQFPNIKIVAFDSSGDMIGCYIIWLQHLKSGSGS